MAGSTRLVDLVQSRLDEFVSEHGTTMAGISPDLGVIEDSARQILAGGKRFRALFCYWGWRAVAGFAPDGELLDDSEPAELPAVVSVASALEVFHAAALVHDDIMDNSDTRRGRPSAHRRFEAWHREQGWSGSARDYGEASALLLGDLLLAWSDELFDSGVRQIRSSDAASAARDQFSLMRAEVTLGQYLDMLEETSWRSRPETELLPRAHRVIVYKSAKYTVEAPLVIGASLADASLAQLAALRAFGLPLGIAFQLRDDLLGVFGDPVVTGKPAGDDLREGKRTVLVTLARQKLPASAGRVFDELLGDRELDDQQVSMLQTAVRDSGAVEQIERLIAHNVGLATQALADAPLTRSAREQLGALAETVSRRSA
ncbi:polyprenyl synthetase family protein [Lysinimonas soli]|uniref:Polyprenyl synthetase family protein n=1 Tax=Lysinimonas soli TaxID=1074233 RepID=A0ABW0NN92_9MICO